MRQFVPRLFRLVAGLFLYGLGVVFTLNANIGYAPWEVFHAGIAAVTGISIGTASITTGLVILLAVLILKEKLGLGTILNIIIIGVCIDFISWLNILPIAPNVLWGIPMLIIGLFLIALGSCFYIGSAFGAGPRDSLMVALTRKTTLPVGACRTIIEFCVVVIGWMLGGMVGIGTIISVFAIGVCVQITFKVMKFNATEVRHETLNHTYRTLFRKQEELSGDKITNESSDS